MGKLTLPPALEQRWAVIEMAVEKALGMTMDEAQGSIWSMVFDLAAMVRHYREQVESPTAGIIRELREIRGTLTEGFMAQTKAADEAIEKAKDATATMATLSTGERELVDHALRALIQTVAGEDGRGGLIVHERQPILKLAHQEAVQMGHLALERLAEGADEARRGAER